MALSTKPKKAKGPPMSIQTRAEALRNFEPAEDDGFFEMGFALSRVGGLDWWLQIDEGGRAKESTRFYQRNGMMLYHELDDDAWQAASLHPYFDDGIVLAFEGRRRASPLEALEDLHGLSLYMRAWCVAAWQAMRRHADDCGGAVDGDEWWIGFVGDSPCVTYGERAARTLSPRTPYLASISGIPFAEGGPWSIEARKDTIAKARTAVRRRVQRVAGNMHVVQLHLEWLIGQVQKAEGK